MTPSCTQNDILKVSKKTQDQHRDRPSISTTKRTYVLTSSRSRTKQNRRKSQMAMIRTTQINSCWRLKSSSGSSTETYSKNTRGTPNIRTASCQSYYTCGLRWHIVNRAKSLHLFLMSFEELTTSTCDPFRNRNLGRLRKSPGSTSEPWNQRDRWRGQSQRVWRTQHGQVLTATVQSWRKQWRGLRNIEVCKRLNGPRSISLANIIFLTIVKTVWLSV